MNSRASVRIAVLRYLERSVWEDHLARTFPRGMLLNHAKEIAFGSWAETVPRNGIS